VAEQPLLTDPVVSRSKFEREVAEYRRLEQDHLRRGWMLLRAEYPEVFIVFANPAMSPPAVIFGALLDFTNYDLWAPSVTLVHPFTREPYKARELPVLFLRRPPAAEIPPQVMAMMQQGVPLEQLMPPRRLLVWYTPDDVPFVCLPGIREYHEHPGHSGDSWLLHRGRGEGTLFFILDQLYKYGVQPMTYTVEMVPVVKLAPQVIPE
jgi:hypothetical protein